MAINEELTNFLKEGLERGLPREQLEETLLEAGWPRDQVRSALEEFADIRFPIPVPRPKPYLFAREAFVYLVLFSTLYVSAFNLGALLFQFIDEVFPPSSGGGDLEAMRWSISLLVVAFPVFVFVSRTNERAIRQDPRRRLSKVRRWLTYLTLFVAASILIGTMTNIVYNLLSGEMPPRWVLQVLTVGTIAGSVFRYFQQDFRNEEKTSSGSVLFVASVITVIAAVGVGLFIIGPPMEERARRFDNRRVEDLEGIVDATELYWTRHSRLPVSLDELTAEPGVMMMINTTDPANSETYGYQAVDSTHYEVCASFEQESGETSSNSARNLWAHDSGLHCFTVEAEEIERNNN